MLERYILKRIIIFSTFFAFVYCGKYDEIFEKFEVVPDVLKIAPPEKVEVVYPTGGIVELGNELTPTLVKHIPRLTWTTEPEAFYTICMVEPDAPTRTDRSASEFQHWLIGNIPGTEIEKGDTLTEYIGSGPLPDIYLNRYVFVVFKQNGKINFTEDRLNDTSVNKRAFFNTLKFAEKYNMSGPIAANFYLCGWDKYATVLRNLLGV